jgi:GAF domain-containing protein
VTERRQVGTEEAALRRIATLATQGVPAETLCAAVAREVGPLLSVDHAYVTRFDADDAGTVLAGWVAGREGPPVALPLQLGSGPISARLRESGGPVRLDPYPGGPGAGAIEARFCSTVAAPISVEGRMWGFVAVVSTSLERPPPPETEERLSRFTELVATAIAIAESRIALAKLADEQAALRRVATVVAQGATGEELFASVAREVATVIGVSMVCIERYDPDACTMVASFGEPRFPLGSRWPLDGPSVGAKVLETAGPARIDDYTGLHSTAAAAMRKASVNSVVGAPILVEGRVWGVIDVGSTDGTPVPEGTEGRLAEFTELVATAIANTESRGEVERLADEQAALRRVATLVARGVSSEEIFRAVSDEVGRLFDTDTATVVRYDGGPAVVVVGAGEGVTKEFPVGSRWEADELFASTKVFRTRRSARIDDSEYISRSGPVVEALRRLGPRRLGSPIVVDGRLWGAITVSTKDAPLPLGSEERLEKFTELVATAIANTQAREELTLLADEQAALRRVATLVARGIAPEEVFRAVASEVGVLFGSDVGAIVRFEDDRTVTVLGDVGGPHVAGKRVTLDPGYVVDVVRETGSSSRFDTGDPSAEGMPSLVQALGVRSAVASPIVVEGELWGAITIASLDGPLPLGAERRLTEFTELVATAVANTESREEVAMLADEQAALRRVAELVAQESSPVQAFGAVTEEAWRVLDAEAVGLLRFESDGTATLVAQSQTPWDPPPLGTPFTLDGENPVARVARTGRVARMDDWTTATGSVAAMATVLGVRSTVATPIVVEERIWGTLIAASSQPEPLPGDTESRIAQFTELIATAIANAEARAEVERLADEQAALRRVATLVAENPESEGLFSAVAREVAGVLDVSGVIVDRFEADGSQVTLGSAYDLELRGAGAFLGVGVRLPLHPGTLAAGVFETRGAARVEDYSTLEGAMGDAARAAGVGSGCAAPIIVDGRLWGQMCVFSRQGMALPAGTENKLDDFVKLVATAISNYDARARLRTLADEQAALRRVATLVAEGVPPAELFSAVTTEVAHVFSDVDPALVVSVIHFEPGPESVLVGASRPYEQEPLGARWAPKELYVSTRVLRTARSARVDEADLDAIGGPDADVLRLRGFLYQVGSPVVVEGQLWGAMCLNSKQDLPPDTEERLEKFTELVATAIANADSQEARAVLTEEQAALRRVATLVAEGVAPSDIFEAVSKEVQGVLHLDAAPSDVATVVRFDPGPECVLVGTSKPIDESPLGSRWEPHDVYVSTRVLRTGKSSRVDEDEVSMEGPEAAKMRRQGYLSQVASPIVVEGRLWGAMTASSREQLPPDTEPHLEKFTELVGAAIANAEAKFALAASRRRIVAASDEARRKIERDLHDGTQQRLVSLGLAVRAAEASAPRGEADLQAALSQIAAGLAEAVEDVQELSRGIHPAILSQGGLAPALRTLARRSRIPVGLDAALDVRLPEPIEVAAYFAASEALANAAKHSQAARIEVSLKAKTGRLLLSIRDDGVGGADPRNGSGLVGLTDRVEALGGSMEILSPAGKGTMIAVELPLELDLDTSPDEALV